MSDPRLPTEHGKKVAEVIDLGGPVARVERLTYVGNEWTNLSIMTPADVDQPAQSIAISLSRKQLEQLLERLAWPT